MAASQVVRPLYLKYHTLIVLGFDGMTSSVAVDLKIMLQYFSLGAICSLCIQQTVVFTCYSQVSDDVLTVAMYISSVPSSLGTLCTSPCRYSLFCGHRLDPKHTCAVLHEQFGWLVWSYPIITYSWAQHVFTAVDCRAQSFLWFIVQSNFMITTCVFSKCMYFISPLPMKSVG